jgi:hypothetical protein
MCGDFPVKNTVYALYIPINVWFWPTLAVMHVLEDSTTISTMLFEDKLLFCLKFSMMLRLRNAACSALLFVLVYDVVIART